LQVTESALTVLLIKMWEYWRTMLGHDEFGNLARPEIFVFFFGLFCCGTNLCVLKQYFRLISKQLMTKVSKQSKKLLHIEIEEKKIKFFSPPLSKLCWGTFALHFNYVLRRRRKNSTVAASMKRAVVW
jgi:hypothetical protein